MKNQQTKLAPTSFLTSVQVLLCGLSLCCLTACGGPSTTPTTPIPDNSDQANVMPDDGSNADSPPAIVLPAIPATPAGVPASLMAEVVLSNPNSQLTQIGTFVDAVMPGMGASALRSQIGLMVHDPDLSGMPAGNGLAVVSFADPQIKAGLVEVAPAMIDTYLTQLKFLNLKAGTAEGLLLIGQEGCMGSDLC